MLIKNNLEIMFKKFSGLYRNNLNKVKNIISTKRFSSVMLDLVNEPTNSVPSIQPSVSSGRKKKKDESWPLPQL